MKILAQKSFVSLAVASITTSQIFRGATIRRTILVCMAFVLLVRVLRHATLTKKNVHATLHRPQVAVQMQNVTMETNAQTMSVFISSAFIQRAPNTKRASTMTTIHAQAAFATTKSAFQSPITMLPDATQLPRVVEAAAAVAIAIVKTAYQQQSLHLTVRRNKQMPIQLETEKPSLDSLFVETVLSKRPRNAMDRRRIQLLRCVVHSVLSKRDGLWLLQS